MSLSGRFPALAVLRRREFARFALARITAVIGWQMLGVAVGWQVYALTRDPLALGLREVTPAVSGDGFTALHFACYFGQPEAARLLIEKEAALDTVSSNPMKLM